jgi:hypothetical protein
MNTAPGDASITKLLIGGGAASTSLLGSTARAISFELGS